MLGYFADQPRTVVDTAAVGIFSPIDERTEERTRQIEMAKKMELDRIESGVDCHLRGGPPELLDDGADFLDCDGSAVRHGRGIDESTGSHSRNAGELTWCHHAGMSELRRYR